MSLLNHMITFSYAHSEIQGLIISDNESVEILREDDGLLSPSFMEDLVSEIGARKGYDYEVELIKFGYLDFITFHVSWEICERALTRALSLLRDILGAEAYYQDVLGLI